LNSIEKQLKLAGRNLSGKDMRDSMRIASGLMKNTEAISEINSMFSKFGGGSMGKKLPLYRVIYKRKLGKFKETP